MAISGVSGYNPYDYQSTLGIIRNTSSIRQSTQQAVQAVERISQTTSKTSAYGDTVEFLSGYQSQLLGLQEAASKLQTGNQGNVFEQYEETEAESMTGLKIEGQPSLNEVTGIGDALNAPAATIAETKANQTAQGTVEESIAAATNKIVSAVKDFADKYNDVTSLLAENTDRGSAVSSHLASFRRGSLDEKSMSAVGLSFDKDGKMQVDEGKLTQAIQNDYDQVKDLIGSQFGLAERTAVRTEAALDTSVQRLVENDISRAVSDSQAAGETSAYDSFRYMSSFSKGGPYNIGNYYAVGLMLNTLA